MESLFGVVLSSVSKERAQEHDVRRPQLIYRYGKRVEWVMAVLCWRTVLRVHGHLRICMLLDNPLHFSQCNFHRICKINWDGINGWKKKETTAARA